MATNAKFEIEIYGETTKFQNSLKGISSALSSLKGEARTFREALKLNPSDTKAIAGLQKNLQQQLKVSKDRAAELKKELSTVDRSTDSGSKRWTKLQRDLANTTIESSKLEAELKDVDAAVKNGKYEVKGKVDIDTSGVNGKLDGVKNKFSGLKEIAIGAFRQIGSSITNAVGNGLKGWVSDAMDTQKAMISLKNTMDFKGNAKEFDTVSKSMSKLATDTNANTEDTLKLATTFIGLGDSASTAVSKTEALVKANQAFGGTGEQLKGVVQAYGQMSAAGKVSAENINQLTDNNTALGSALKSTVMEMNPALKQYGSFAAASEKGAISVEMLDKAMQKLGTAGGGAVTTIGDAWDSFNETLSLALLPTLDALTPVISSIIDKMAGWGEKAGDAIGGIVQYVQLLYYELEANGAVASFAGALSNMRIVFSQIFGIIGDLISSFLGLDEQTLKNATSTEKIAAALKAFSDKLLNTTAKLAIFLAKLRENEAAMTALKGVVVVLAAAFAAFKVSKGILAIVSAFNAIRKAVTLLLPAVKALFGLLIANPFVAIAVALAALVAGLVFFFTQTEKGKQVWQGFVEFLSTSIEAIKNFFIGLGTYFVEIWQNIVETTKQQWQGITEFFNGLVEGIKTIWTNITTFFSDLWNSVVTVTQTVWNTITTFIGGVVQSIMNFFQPLISFYQSLWNLILSIINLVLQLILAGVRGVVQGIQSFFQAAGNFINNVWQNVLNFFRPIMDAVRNVVQVVTTAVGNFFQSAYQRVVSVWNAVTGFFSGLFNSVRQFASNLFTSIGNFASNAVNSIRNFFSPIGSFFSNTFNSVKNSVSGVFNAFGEFASNAVNSVRNAFGGLVDFFSSIFGNIKKIVDNTLGGITSVIDGITSAVNGVAGKVSGLFKGSLVSNLSEVNLKGSEGMSQNSVSSSDNRTYNSFTINSNASNITALAREITRLQNQGRA